MSTRSVIRLKQFDRVIDIYHHYDGYPTGVGFDLLAEIDNWFEHRPEDYKADADEFATHLVKNNEATRKLKREDNGYILTVFQHWDAEYLYEIDFGKCVDGRPAGLTKQEMKEALKCYELKMHFDDGYEGYDKRKSIDLLDLKRRVDAGEEVEW